MSTFREYAVSETALAQARKLGMYGDVDGKLKKMARLAARFTHPLANRRYQNYLLKIDGDVISDIIKFSPDELAKYESRTYRERRAGVGPGEPLPVTAKDVEKARQRMKEAVEEFGPVSAEKASDLPYHQQYAKRLRKPKTE